MKNTKNCQSGLSLIELLIAMLIGVFLLAGIANSYISSKKTSVDRDQISLLEDNGRIALESISKIIQHAGYSSQNPNIIPFITKASDVASGVCPDGSQSVANAGLFTANQVVGDNAAGDSIGVVFYGDSNLYKDCSGGKLPVSCRNAQTKVFNSFYITGNTLKCAGSRQSGASVIADGVENMQFLYGVDTNGDDLVDKYINATSLSTNKLWRNVVSIQVALLVRTLKPFKSSSESKTYTLLDQSVTSANDKYERQVFTTTVRLRNTL